MDTTPERLALHFPGDPTMLGWLAVLVYACAAWFCLSARRAAQIDHQIGRAHWRSRFWSAMAWLLLLLGMNKQLDLQTLLISMARQLSKSQGWYEQRRPVQIAAVALIAFVAFLACSWIVWLVRRDWRQYGLALFGLGLLAAFVILRFAYFEEMDSFVGVSLRAVRAKWVLEFGGIICIGLAAWRHSRRPPSSLVLCSHPLN